MDNIVSVKLDSRYASTLGVWQYDYGQVLRITGPELPPAVEVQFSLDEKSGETLSRVGTTVDGVTEVKIPDELLTHSATSNYRIYVYIYLTDETSGNTKYEITIPVRVRSKPTSPTEDPETDPDLFRETVAAVNASAERAENAASSATESAASAEETLIEIKRVTDGISEDIENANTAKSELSDMINSAEEKKKELVASTEEAGETKTELDSSIKSAGEKKLALDATVERANAVDGSLKEHIGSAEQIQANVEQIGKNTQAISLLNEEIGELPNNIVSSTDSFVQYNYTVKSGEKHRFGLFDYSGDYFKQCEIYLFKGDNSYKQIGILRNVGEFIDYDVADNYVFVRYVFQTTEPESKTVTKRVYSHISTSNSLSDEVEENRQVIFKNAKAIATNNKSIDKVTSTVNDFKSFIGEKKEEVYTITSSPTWEKTEITLVKNTKYDISVEKNDNIKNVMLYDTGYNIKEMIYNRDQGLTGISYTTTENFTAMLLVYLVDESISTDVKLSIKSGLMGKDEISKDDINVLIIGDSYSALGNWVNELSKMVNINNLVNLGVSSATLKDKHKDTTLYPYTSRPVMISSDGNLNVFHNQILKLKRLMDGTDLDSGESKIYTTPDEYPDVIFIEGGTNDNADSATNDYQNILYNQKNVM